MARTRSYTRKLAKRSYRRKRPVTIRRRRKRSTKTRRRRKRQRQRRGTRRVGGTSPPTTQDPHGPGKVIDKERVRKEEEARKKEEERIEVEMAQL